MARGMIPTDLFHIQWVSDARLSPDGRLVAFTVTRLDKEADDYRAAIWLGPADGSTPPTGTAEIRVKIGHRPMTYVRSRRTDVLPMPTRRAISD